MIKILSESGHERNRNAGDEAYFSTMVRLFRHYLAPVHIVAFSDRPERDRSRYGIETVYSGGTMFKTLKSLLNILRTIRACDVYVWGGGQILRDDTGIKSPLYRLSRPFIAKIMGKAVMAYAIGIGPLETRTARFLAKHILNTFDIITVRDSVSLGMLKHIGVSKPPIHLTVDPAFSVGTASHEEIAEALRQLSLDPDVPLVGVAPFGPAFRGVRSLLPAKYQVRLGMWRPGGKAKYEQHVRTMAMLCDYVVEKYQAALLFVAQDTSWQGRDDRVSADIVCHMDHAEKAVIINADDYRPELVTGLIRKMEFMMGGRMHCLILACHARTPVLGTCFEDKIRSLGEIIRQQPFFLDMEEIHDVKDIRTLIDRLWQERSAIKAQLNQRVKELEAEVVLNVRRLAQLAVK